MNADDLRKLADLTEHDVAYIDKQLSAVLRACADVVEACNIDKDILPTPVYEGIARFAEIKP